MMSNFGNLTVTPMRKLWRCRDASKNVNILASCVVAGILLLPGMSHAGSGSKLVAGTGETLSWPHAFKYYRLILKQVSGSQVWESDDKTTTTKWIRMSEIALYDATGTRINLGLTPCTATTDLADMGSGTCKPGGRFCMGDSFDVSVLSYMFDGKDTSELSTWINANPDDAQAWTWGYVYMRLPENAAPLVSYNLCSTQNNPSSMLVSWALEGSDDGAAWHSLDSVVGGGGRLPGYDEGKWYNGGCSMPVKAASISFTVERDGTLSFSGDTSVKDVQSFGGTVSIGADASLGIDVAEGKTSYAMLGKVQGKGTFEKTGAGTLVVNGVDSGFGGRVKASGGTLAFSPLHAPRRFAYYRFVVKDRDAAVTKVEKLKVAELALYGKDGVRLNQGLTVASEECAATTNLLPGTYAVYGQCNPWGGNFNDVFDGDAATFKECWIQPNNAEWAWLYFTMCLREDDVPAYYNVSFASEYNVRSWALQGSDDHFVWETLDEVDAAAVSAIAPSGAGWCNDGRPLPLFTEESNPPVGEVDAKFFRYTIKAVGPSSGGTRAICELALYDWHGKRLNFGLENKGRKADVPSLTAGSFTYACQWDTPNFNNNADSFGPQMMFDGNLATRMSGWNFGNKPTPENSSTWISFTMRLADNAPPVASYNFAPNVGGSESSCTPIAWTVEASRDGLAWFVVDDRSGDTATALLPSVNNSYCNNGRPIRFSAGCDRWLAPTGAVVSVEHGARVELPAVASCAVRGLEIEVAATGLAGTVANFSPMSGGTLYLTGETSCESLQDTAIVAFENVSNAANLESWTVVADGKMPRNENEFAIRIDENGLLRVTRSPPGLVIVVK